MLLNLLPSNLIRMLFVVPTLAGCLPLTILAQTDAVKPTIPPIEAGLEQVVKWTWTVEPSDAAAWGLPVDVPAEVTEVRRGEPVPTPKKDGKAPPAKVVPTGPPATMLEHVVAKGDSLTKIAHAHGVTVDQLRIFNEMKNDRIVIGQVVKVPGENDIKVMVAAAAEAEKAAAKEAPTQGAHTTPRLPPYPVAEAVV